MSNNNCLPQKPPNPSVCIISPKMFESLVPDISFSSEWNKDDFTVKQGNIRSYMPNCEGESEPNNSKTEQIDNWKSSVTTTNEKSYHSELNSAPGRDKFSNCIDLPTNYFQEQLKLTPKNVVDESNSVRNYLGKQHSRFEEICKPAIKCGCCMVSNQLNCNDQNRKINQPCMDFVRFQAQETSKEILAQPVFGFNGPEMQKYTNGNMCCLSNNAASQRQFSDNNNRFQANSECNNDTVKQIQILKNRNEEIFEYVKLQDRKIDNIQEQVSYLLNEHSKLKNDLLAQNVRGNSTHGRNTNSDIDKWEKLENRMESQLRGFFKMQNQNMKEIQKQVAMLQDSENRKIKCDSWESTSIGTDVFKSDNMRKNVGSPSMIDALSQTMDNSVSNASGTKCKTCSIGTMTNLTGMKDDQICKPKKIKSKQNHDSRSKSIRTKPVDTDIVASEKSPKTSLEENRGHHVTSKNKQSPKDIHSEKFNPDFGLNEVNTVFEYEDHSDSTLSNELGSYHRHSLENKKSHRRESRESISEDFREKVVGNIDRIILSQETKSPNFPKNPKSISPPIKNQHSKLDRCNQENFIGQANKTSLHNTVVSKHLSKMSNSSVDMSYEFRRMQAKYFGESDILEVQTSCTVTRNNFSQGTLEYLQSHGLLQNSRKTNAKSAKK